MSAGHDITALLEEWASGNQQALDEVTERLYKELRLLAKGYLRRERPDHSLSPTAVVSEAYVRLLGQKQRPFCENRSQFFTIAAHLMRQILVDHARRRQARKRAGFKLPIEITLGISEGRSANLLALEDGLEALEQLDPRKCRVIELCYFGGLSIKEIATMLCLSTKTISRDLALAEAWLYREMQKTKLHDTGPLGTS